MIIENTAALQFLLSDDIYLVKDDINRLNTLKPEPVDVAEAPAVVVPELPVTETPVLNFQYLGNNGKRFLVVCCYPDLDSMDDKHLEALKSALQRKELALDDIAILNVAKHNAATSTDLTEYFKPERLLILGAPCLLNGWDKLTFNKLENVDSVKALYTYSFTEMMGDRDKTKAFWEQMKVL